MTLCHIALGGNLGDVEATFAAALERLSSGDLHVRAVSHFFATPAMGSGAGGRFLNAAASLETSLRPLAVLDRLLSVEDALGRQRNIRWGPRVIDLDLVLYGEEVINEPRLRVPHPGCWHRRFVLDPLDEIAPDAVHTESRETIRSLRARLLVRPFLVACDDESLRSRLTQTLSDRFPAVEWSSDVRTAAMTFSRTVSCDDPAARVISLPSDDVESIEAASAVLVAALSEPVEFARFDRSVGDRSSQHRYKPRNSDR